jgi:DNA-binding NtrC family response regulator
MDRGRLRVLVVDDEDLCRWTTGQLLARLGHEVAEAASSDAALDLLERWGPDAVLLDVRLPGMDGFECLARIRLRRPAVRTIMMTGHATVEAAVAALRGGAVDFLVKPLDPAELEEALARDLGMPCPTPASHPA